MLTQLAGRALTPHLFARPPAGATAGGGNPRRGGFTFIEMMLVLTLLGILFSFAAPNLDGLTPKYRLRTGARQLGVDIEVHRLAAISRSTWLGIRYTIEGDDTYYQLYPAPPPEYPNQPVEERTPYARQRFPDGVRLRSVQVRGSGDVVDSGSVLILFSPDGTRGSHSATLENREGQTWTMKFNAITGSVDYVSEEEAGFDDFEG